MSKKPKPVLFLSVLMLVASGVSYAGNSDDDPPTGQMSFVGNTLTITGELAKYIACVDFWGSAQGDKCMVGSGGKYTLTDAQVRKARTAGFTPHANASWQGSIQWLPAPDCSGNVVGGGVIDAPYVVGGVALSGVKAICVGAAGKFLVE